MKKLIRLSAFFLAIVLLAGCSGSGYRFVGNGDNSFISLNYSYSAEVPEDAYVCIEAPYVSFSSWEEMREDIKLGRFTEDELKNIAQFRKNTEGKIIAPNVSVLPSPTYPDRFEISRVYWGGGDDPLVELRTDGAATGMELFSKEKINQDLDIHYFNPQHGKYGIEKVGSIPNANGELSGKVYYFTDMFDRKKKIVNYEFTVKSATFYVQEEYLLDSVADRFVFLRIWYVDEASNCWSYIYIFGSDSKIIPFKLSIEEIAQFGFKK